VNNGQNNVISVIIPTYNRYDFLNNCIDSLCKQTYRNFEIIVVDDCSTDERYGFYKTITEVEGIPFKYVKLDINHKNPSIARNKGMELAKGELIKFLDDDDSLLPYCLEIQSKKMEEIGSKFSCTEGYYSKYDVTYDSNTQYPLYMGETYSGFIKLNTGRDKLPKFITFAFLKEHNYIITSSVMIHRDLIKQVGIFILGGVYNKWEDWSYWIRCSEKESCFYIDTPLVFYNDTPRNKWIKRIDKIISDEKILK